MEANAWGYNCALFHWGTEEKRLILPVGVLAQYWRLYSVKECVWKFKEVKTGWYNFQELTKLAESSEENYGSKGLFCRWWWSWMRSAKSQRTDMKICTFLWHLTLFFSYFKHLFIGADSLCVHIIMNISFLEFSRNAELMYINSHCYQEKSQR